ncbi:UPF0193 protein EVG1 isoform X2 [Archocentrus centrarchus]|uniref:UPF0193 protein EVG1 isoform X2 n=1 Tax=Archocentrus centrarchus TaxID=63155 RepID=UPI0011E9F797|nr:UPF0193 protein EVG1 isoform X2 [Archocentrus centrarchus]
METSSQSTAGGGLWNSPRATQFNKETQDMLKLMKQESRVTSLKRKQINRYPKSEAALPLTSAPAQPSTPDKSVQKGWPVRTQKRAAEGCRSGDSYAREKFCPGPTRDLEKEKQKLQNIFALGTEQPRAGSSQKSPLHHSSEAPKMDRYEEVLNEIEERQQFLEDMASLGQEKEYIDIINTEISQKIRELEILEKARVPRLDTRTESRIENAADKED